MRIRNKDLEKKYQEARKQKYKEDSEYRLKSKERTKKYYEANKDKINQKTKITGKIYRDANKEKRKLYRESIKEKQKIYQKEYRLENKLVRNKKTKERAKKDIIFAITIKIRSMLTKNFNRNGFTKKSKTADILGCSFDKFKEHLESKFESWMNWENRGKYNGKFNFGWDIDHIIPLSTAKTEDDIIKLNHYTNLQPLCSKINREIKRAN